MSGLFDLAAYLRRGGAVITALVDHARNGTPLPEGFLEAADESSQHLLVLSQTLNANRRAP
ncbi:MAG: hypothetical protein AB7F89_08780 [Pirellulaceae bacterium]